MKKTILPIIAILFLIHLVPAYAAECQVYDTLTGKVLLDSDCDGYPDNDDTCPTVSNPDQLDTNRDGRGDLCETTANSRQVTTADSRLNPATTNSRPSTANMPPVGLQMQGQVGTQAGGYQAGTTASLGTLSDVALTYVTTHGLERGGPGEFYAVNVHNLRDVPVVVSLRPQGISPWGSYTVRPSTTIIVPAQGDGAFYLFVKANFNAEAGKKSFTADVTTESGEETLAFEAFVEEAAQKEFTFFNRLNLQLSLIILIIIILIIGIILGLKNYLKKV